MFMWMTYSFMSWLFSCRCQEVCYVEEFQQAEEELVDVTEIPPESKPSAEQAEDVPSRSGQPSPQQEELEPENQSVEEEPPPQPQEVPSPVRVSSPVRSPSPEPQPRPQPEPEPEPPEEEKSSEQAAEPSPVTEQPQAAAATSSPHTATQVGHTPALEAATTYESHWHQGYCPITSLASLQLSDSGPC